MANYFEWEQPTENGDVKYLLLTSDGYESLLKPIETGGLGGLASELLTIRKTIIELNDRVVLLEEKNEKLEAEVELLKGGETEQGNEAKIQALKDKYTVSKMKSLLKGNGVRGYSNKKEQELAEMLCNNNIE